MDDLYRNPDPPMHVVISDRDLPGYAKRPHRFILRYIKRHATRHVLVVSFTILGAASNAGTSFILSRVVDALQAAGPDRSSQMANVFIGTYIGLLVLESLLLRIASLMTAGTFPRVVCDVRNDLLRYALGHDVSYYSNYVSGSVAGRINSVSEAINQIENIVANRLIQALCNILFSIALMGTANGWMVLATTLLSVVISAVMYVLYKRDKAKQSRFASSAARRDGDMLDIIDNINLVKSSGTEHAECVRFWARASDDMQARIALMSSLQILQIGHAAMSVAISCGLVVWSFLTWRAGHMTIGSVVLVMTITYRFLFATREISLAVVDSASPLATIAEGIEKLLEAHRLPDPPGAMNFAAPVAGSVVFDQTAFAYPGGKSVLADFDFAVKPSQHVGIVGSSGSGKSTVLMLIQRLAALGGGSVRVDEVDIATLRQSAIQGAIAVVSQEVHLFNRSIRENVLYGNGRVSEQELREAAKAAACLDFIDEQPHGFDTMLAQKGGNLSGGQRQRLSILRAFLSKKPIILLDEATSALDIQTERDVMEGLRRLMRDRTVIAVTHRFATLDGFDRVILMESGHIVQDDAPSVLASTKGPFRSLLQLQTSAS